MSAVAANKFVSRMVEREIAVSGSRDRALDNLSRQYGLTRSQLRHLRSGRAKTVDVGLFQRIRLAYLDYCQRMIATLEHELAVERATGDIDAHLECFEREAQELASKIVAARASTISRAAR